MTREEVKVLLPIMQAFAEGKAIQQTDGYDWYDLDDPDFMASGSSYRIKPDSKVKSKYHPFKNTEECWNEMLKHKPFGWLKDKNGNKLIIENVDSRGCVEVCDEGTCTFKDIFEDYTFIDDTPFGIKK